MDTANVLRMFANVLIKLWKRFQNVQMFHFLNIWILSFYKHSRNVNLKCSLHHLKQVVTFKKNNNIRLTSN